MHEPRASEQEAIEIVLKNKQTQKIAHKIRRFQFADLFGRYYRYWDCHQHCQLRAK